ncbi:DUF397 domain-containing protein [Saccharopolyspora sp. 7B]|uniref:DUF397 domain-containing protein n=1 Tax=Saccharopolyspora sp. 7B TaxID=2877240 RepID=UPI001CD47C5A|nr:DUF397 domain-containing protein [Saccharopolyspora sp. 7B]MCA1278364.1 DUF397 domain-containing protein [Saccharopolyspora sp. 7B]
MTSKNTGSAGRAETGGWFKSSYSHPNGNQCVEVCFGADLVRVRDSKEHGEGPVLGVSAARWAAFIELVGRSSER